MTQNISIYQLYESKFEEQINNVVIWLQRQTILDIDELKWKEILFCPDNKRKAQKKAVHK